jgi:hypothetical protein
MSTKALMFKEKSASRPQCLPPAFHMELSEERLPACREGLTTPQQVVFRMT